MQIPAGILIDRYNNKLILTTAVAVAVLGTLIFSLADNMFWAVLSRFLMGLGSAFAFVSAGTLTARHFPNKWFVVMFGLTQALACIFAAFGQSIGTILLHSFTWQALLYGLFFIGAGLCVFIFIFIPGKVQSAKESILSSVWHTFQQPQLWLCALYAGFKFGVILAFASLWNVAFQQSLHLSLSKASQLNAMIFYGIALGSPLLSYISTKVGRRVIPMQVSTTITLMIMMLLCYFPASVLNNHVLQGLMFLLGVFAAASMLAFAVGKENLPLQYSGVGVGLINMSVFVVSGVLQIIPAKLIQLFDTLRQPHHTTSLLYHLCATHFNINHVVKGLTVESHFRSALLVMPMSFTIALLATYFIKETYCQSQYKES
jgi:MFS family permease